MSSAQRVLGNIRFATATVTKASSGWSYDVAFERRIVETSVAAVASATPRASRGVVVELKPRTFSETAAHFLSIAQPVEWPVDDEADID
jgi:hypothetical protein